MSTNIDISTFKSHQSLSYEGSISEHSSWLKCAERWVRISFDQSKSVSTYSLRLQKKAKRIITKSPPRAHIYLLFKTPQILDILKIMQMSLALYFSTNKIKLHPIPLSFLFISNSDFHKFTTRQKDHSYIFSHRYIYSFSL